MRIAMLGWEFPPSVSGGLGVHCYHLTNALCRLGVQVDFFMPSFGRPAKPGHENLRIFEVSKTSLGPYSPIRKKTLHGLYGDNLASSLEEYGREAASLVQKMHAQNPYNIIHAHDWLCAKAGKSAKLALNIPLVQTFHSTELDRNPFPWDYIFSLERKAASDADRIIAVSNRMKGTLEKSFSARPEKIRVIYNAVSHDDFSCKGKSAPNLSPPLFYKRKKVLFLGRLTEQKGPSQFLHAAKKALQAEPETLFLVAGTGNLLAHLINLSISLGISKNVIFLGYITDEDRHKIYSECDVYVLPSVSEPFGISALEAMASGTPAIVSKNSGIGEASKSVLKVDFWDTEKMAEQIVAVLRYSPLAKTMSGLSYSEARKFSWDTAARETLKVYQELA